MGKAIAVGTLFVILPIGGVGMLCGLFAGDMALIFFSGIGGMVLSGLGLCIGGAVAWLDGEMERGANCVSPAPPDAGQLPRLRRRRPGSGVRPGIEELGG